MTHTAIVKSHEKSVNDKRISLFGLDKSVFYSESQLQVVASIAELLDHTHKHTQLNNQSSQLLNFYRSQVGGLSDTIFSAPECNEADLDSIHIDSQNFVIGSLPETKKHGIYFKLDKPKMHAFTAAKSLGFDSIVVLLNINNRGAWNLRVAKRTTVGWKIPVYAIQLDDQCIIDYVNGIRSEFTTTNILHGAALPPDDVLQHDVDLAIKLLVAYIAQYQAKQLTKVIKPIVKLNKIGSKRLNILM